MHFVEEIEHRSSALRIHHHVTSDPWYRIREAAKVFDHVANIYKLVLAGFEEHVPLESGSSGRVELLASNNLSLIA